MTDEQRDDLLISISKNMFNIQEILFNNKKELNNKIDGVEERLNNKIDGVEESLKKEFNDKIDAVEEKLNNKIDNVEANLKKEMKAIVDDAANNIKELWHFEHEKDKNPDLTVIDFKKHYKNK